MCHKFRICCYGPNTDILKSVAKSSPKHFVPIYKTTLCLIPEVRIFTFVAVGISDSVYDRVLLICYKKFLRDNVYSFGPIFNLSIFFLC